MKPCPNCSREHPEIYRYCTACGTPLDSSVPANNPTPSLSREALNLQVLYGMVAVLVLALLFPPWETPPTQPPEFLGLHFILAPPTPEAVVSRLLMTIELVTIAIAGLYGAFLMRNKT
jgi:zinc ribbon protein